MTGWMDPKPERYKEVGEYSVIKYYHETDKKEKKKPRVSTHPNMWPSDDM